MEKSQADLLGCFPGQRAPAALSEIRTSDAASRILSEDDVHTA